MTTYVGVFLVMFKLFRKYNKYLIRINYKSGQSVKFWVYAFKITSDEASWHTVCKKPILLNIDEIESVWLLRGKEGRKGNKK